MWGKGKVLCIEQSRHIIIQNGKGEDTASFEQKHDKAILIIFIFIISGQRDTLLCYKEQRIVWILLHHQPEIPHLLQPKIKLNKTTPHPFVLYYSFNPFNMVVWNYPKSTSAQTLQTPKR